jgi:quercetin dioxygenase-like cupin family protein
MTIFRATESPMKPADVRTFTGPARTKLLASSEEGTRVHVYRVEFDRGGRTNWHIHSGPQWLFVMEGRIRVQAWLQAAEDLDAGDAVVISPGEKHWHGAAPETTGAHIAVNVNLETTWLEAVGEP